MLGNVKVFNDGLANKIDNIKAIPTLDHHVVAYYKPPINIKISSLDPGWKEDTFGFVVNAKTLYKGTKQECQRFLILLIVEFEACGRDCVSVANPSQQLANTPGIKKREDNHGFSIS